MSDEKISEKVAERIPETLIVQPGAVVFKNADYGRKVYKEAQIDVKPLRPPSHAGFPELPFDRPGDSWQERKPTNSKAAQFVKEIMSPPKVAKETATNEKEKKKK
jgi:hypothetical protein